MERQPRLEFNSRITPPATPRSSPLEHSAALLLDRNTMSPSQTRHVASPRKVSRSYNAPTARVVADDARSFVFERDASPGKYWHHFNEITEPLDVGPPSTSEHQVKQDPSGTLKSTIVSRRAS